VVCQPIKLLCPVVDDCPDLGEAPARVLQTTLIEQKVCSANSPIRQDGTEVPGHEHSVVDATLARRANKRQILSLLT